ncbi:MAG: bifunctional folylpolyglutamate synthase/dihydrofolate synthase [Candidatus Hydrogenedentes bacterium]|nr:bifunctional folylpolyglutamate synthase/dihydrofolate synthase [Candidatus Hydrogenedentota bacterium]
MITPQEYLFGLEEHGIKFGLSNIRHMLASVGNPQLKYRTVHVAGTNGKGSTVAFLSSVLREAGFSVGRYTSPHLLDFSERIVVDDVPISEAELDELILMFLPVAEQMPEIDSLERPTYFEFGTAVAFQHFYQKRVDFAVIETGLGGRLDSTNVLEPEVIAITTVDIDHAQYLGNSISQIAFEKASIIRAGAPVVTAARHSDAIKVIRDKCRETGSSLFVHGVDFSHDIEPAQFPLQRMNFSSRLGELRDLAIPLAGAYQGENAALAAMMSLILKERFPAITDEYIRNGLATTRWPCRLDLVRTNPLTIIDGAHNPSAAAIVRDEIRAAFPDKKVTLILAVSGDKNAAGIVSVLSPIAANLIVTRYSLHRAMPAETLYEIARQYSDNCATEPTLEAALARADSEASGDSLILITGSLYLAGDAIKLLSSKTSTTAATA